MRSISLLLASGVLFAIPLLQACGPGAVAAAVRPDAPTYAAASGERECRATDGSSEPLVVDFRPEERVDLEVAMRDGVAVVAYDCKAFRVLKDCRIDGTYGFVGTTTKEQVIQLDNSDEIRTNLPLSGLKIAGKIEGELQRGASLDIALMMVGKKRTTWAAVTKDDLRGTCAGATHFVRGATVGAFAMETGAKAKVRAAVEIFGGSGGASSASSKNVKNRDGSLESCKAANPEAASAPAQCGALLKLELLGIGATKPDDRIVSENSCPRGLVLSKGKCTTPTAALPHLCIFGNLEECTTQCNKGDPGSCANLGGMFMTGRSAEQSDTQAVKFYKLACDQGSPRGCVGLAALYDGARGGLEDSPEKAFTLNKKACEDGNSNGCANLGVAYEKGRGVPKDSAKAQKLFKVGCDAGEPNACFNAGLSYQKGFAGTPDMPTAARLYQLACDGGDARACSNLGILYKTGEGGIPKNPARAMALYRRTCESDNTKYAPVGCNNLAELYKEGVGVPKNRDKAIEYYRRGCKGGVKESCDDLKSLGAQP